MTAASLANARRDMAVEQVKECGGGGGALLVMHGDVVWRRLVRQATTCTCTSAVLFIVCALSSGPVKWRCCSLS